MDQVNQYQDQRLQCRDCKAEFVFEAGEQKFFAERNFVPPSRCKECRRTRKQQQQTEQTTQASAPPPAANAGGSSNFAGEAEVQRGRPSKKRQNDNGRRRNDFYDD